MTPGQSPNEISIADSRIAGIVLMLDLIRPVYSYSGKPLWM
ncbi:MAG: hypothetical protein ACYDBV_08025 [Nitrospiria bacterium]